jgi:hypothetical protein
VKWLAADRSRWRSFVKALCSYTGDSRNWWWWRQYESNTLSPVYIHSIGMPNRV